MYYHLHHNLVKYNMIYGGQGLVNDGVYHVCILSSEYIIPL